MNVFEHYLEGAEREAYIEEFTFENNMARLDTLYEMTNLQLSQMYRDAELKVLTECGTYDDFQYLIEEADKEAGEKKQGIIASIFTAIGELLKKIGNAITGLFNKKNDIPDNATIEIPDPVYVVSKEVEKLTSSVSDGVSALAKGDTATAVKVLGAISIPVLTIGGGVAYKKISKNEAFNILGSLKKARDTVTNGINSVIGFFKKDNNQGDNNQNTQDAKKQDEGKEASGPIKKFTTLVNELIKHFQEAINKVTGKGNNDSQEGNEEDQNKAGAKPEGKSTSGEGVNKMMTDGDWTFYIDTKTGEVTRSKKGSSDTPVAVTQNEIPQQVLDASNAIKNKAKNTNTNKNGNKSENNQNDSKTEQNDQNGNQNNDQNNDQQPSNEFRGNNATVVLSTTTGAVTIKYDDGRQIVRNGGIATARNDISNIGLKDKYNEIANKWSELRKAREDAKNGKQTNESVLYDEFVQLLTEAGCDVEVIDDSISFRPSFDIACVGYLTESGYDVYLEDGKIIVNDSVDTSRQKSIFGVDYSDEFTESTNSAFDEELDELSKMFSEL